MPIAGKPSTYVKSFFAESVQAAMEQARVELGPDALLLEFARGASGGAPSGRLRGGLRQPAPEPPASARACRPADAQRGGAAAADGRDPRTAGPHRRPRRPPSAADGEVVARALMRAGVEPALAREIEEAARQRMARRSVPAHRRAASGGRIRRSESAAARPPKRSAASFAVAPEIGRVTALVVRPDAARPPPWSSWRSRRAWRRGAPCA